MPYLAQLGLPYASGSDTSRDAAIAAASFVCAQGRLVLAYIRQRGSATQREASEGLGIGRPSCCARFRALELCGAIAKTSARRQACAVYVPLDRGALNPGVERW